MIVVYNANTAELNTNPFLYKIVVESMHFIRGSVVFCGCFRSKNVCFVGELTAELRGPHIVPVLFASGTPGLLSAGAAADSSLSNKLSSMHCPCFNQIRQLYFDTSRIHIRDQI